MPVWSGFFPQSYNRMAGRLIGIQISLERAGVVNHLPQMRPGEVPCGATSEILGLARCQLQWRH